MGMRASRPLLLAPLLGAAIACGAASPAADDGAGTPTPAPPAAPAPPASAAPDAPDAAAGPSAPRGIYPLHGLDPDGPRDDLDAAAHVLDGAEVLAFGETVHTSEGYARARLRLIRYLVESGGVRAVAFEGPWGAAEATRGFVERQEGSLTDALRGLTFRAWTSKASADLLTFLAGWNRAHAGDPVRLFGFDVQDPSHDGAFVRAFFAKAAPGEAARARALDACLGARFDDLGAALRDPEDGPLLRLEGQLPEPRHTACLGAAADVGAYLAANEAALLRAASREELALAAFAARAIAGNDGMYFHFLTDPRRSYEARDEGMADGFSTLHALRAPGKRAAIVAHNSHIMARRGEIVSRRDGWRSMGTWLGERLGDRYAPVGLVAHRVEYDWDGSGVTKERPRDGELDVERPFAELGYPQLLVDLRQNDVLTPGTSYDLSATERGVPARHYRALVFLEHSPPFVDP